MLEQMDELEKDITERYLRLERRFDDILLILEDVIAKLKETENDKIA